MGLLLQGSQTSFAKTMAPSRLGLAWPGLPHGSHRSPHRRRKVGLPLPALHTQEQMHPLPLFSLHSCCLSGPYWVTSHLFTFPSLILIPTGILQEGPLRLREVDYLPRDTQLFLLGSVGLPHGSTLWLWADVCVLESVRVTAVPQSFVRPVASAGSEWTPGGHDCVFAYNLAAPSSEELVLPTFQELPRRKLGLSGQTGNSVPQGSNWNSPSGPEASWGEGCFACIDREYSKARARVPCHTVTPSSRGRAPRPQPGL